MKRGRKHGGGRSPIVLKKLGDKKMRPHNEAKEFRDGRWSARVEGTLGRNRDMLDSQRLAPYPELTFHFFGGSNGARTGGEMRPESLCPSLSPWRGPDIQMVTSQPLQRAGRREGAALALEKTQDRGEVITMETFGGERVERYDRG